MTVPMHVLIAACGQPALLRRTLRSFAECVKPAGFRGVLVIENGPRSGLEAVVREFGSGRFCRYLYSEPANKSLALNRGLDLVREGLCLFTDDDVLVSPETLVAYARAADDRQGGFFGGPIIPDYEGEAPPTWLRPYLPRSAAGWHLESSHITEIGGPEFIGPNFAALAEDILRVGGYDTRLGPGRQMTSPGEDTEIQERLLAHGVRGFYVPEAGMRHFVRRDSTTLAFAVERAERNGIYWGIQRALSRGFLAGGGSKIGYWKMYGQWLNDRWRIARWRKSADVGTRAKGDFVEARWRGRWEGIRVGRTWDLKRGTYTSTDLRRAA